MKKQKNKIIKIGPHNFTYRELDTLRCSTVSGECGFEDLSITIDKNLAYTVKFTILLHEIVEAINEQYELCLEHHTVQTLGNSLTQVLLDNDIFNVIEIEKE